MKKIKILFLIPSLNLGGAEVLLINHINNISRDKFKPALMIVGKNKELLYRVKEDVIIFEINSSRFFYFFSLFNILRLVKTFNPEIIHSHLLKANLLSRIIKFFSWNTKIINHYHGLSEWAKFEFYFDRYSGFLMDNAIVVSQRSYELRLLREKINPNKLKLIYNFVNFFPKNLKYKNNKNKIVLGMACRLIKLKNIISVVNLVGYLNKNGLDVRLNIAGDGPEKNNIIKSINKNKLNDKITLLGYMDNLDKFYKSINIYVVASETEDLPISLIESLSYGNGVISSDVGGISSIIKSENGLIISKINSSYYKKISEYLQNIDLKFIFDENRKIVLKNFIYKKYEEDINKIYNSNL